MCKLILIPNASKIKNFSEFSKEMADLLSDQGDGYGHAVQGEKGVFGIRTLNPMLYSKSTVKLPDFVENPTEKFGIKSKIIGGAMFHGRISTNHINLLNTHPISLKEWHCVHNGVVTNHGKEYPMLTTNDSEHVLHNFKEGGIKQVSQNLTGYYAAGIFDDKGLMHIFRDEIANLYYSHSKKLKTDIFATTEDLIESIGDLIDEELVGVKVKDNTYISYQNGARLSVEKFVSLGYDSHSASHSEKSLGRKIDFKDDIGYTKDYFDEWDDLNDVYEDVCEEFLTELEYFDYSYQFFLDDVEMSLEDFYMLGLADQICCKIKRYDGSIVKTFKERKLA